MPKIDITRTELVWPGKYDDEGNLVPPRRVALPFQVIERVNETRATREKKERELAGHVGTLFDFWQAEDAQRAAPDDGWRNKLIWGDNLYVIGSLLEHFAGEVDLIYIDPPFATGADFSFVAQVGDSDLELAKKQSAIEEKAYRDTWGKGLDSYSTMMWERLLLMKSLLSPTGTIAVHVDWRVGYLVKAMLDELFGVGSFINEIIWYYTGAGISPERFSRRHDNIYWYANGSNWFFDPDPLRTEYSEATKERFSHYIGNIRGDHDFGVQELNPKGKHPDDVIQVSIEAPSSNERTGYATQKPLKLLTQLISGLVPPDGLVADLFAGSGTTLKACELTGRRWIGSDLSRYAVHTTRKRLMDIPDCRSFEILNLGRYERQVWQGVTFGKKKQPQQMLVFEYLKFILDLYGAQPLAGTQHLHGKRGSAMVHVGAVDAPVTIDEIGACLAECRQMKQKELHVLGWEWEMGLANLMVDEAKGQGIRLLLLNIPREVMEQQAVDKGDIHFYELAYLEVDIQPSRKKRSYTVTLTDFVIPNTELVPAEVRTKVKKWSDYVDYWAIDWDFQDDTFVNSWTSYRTRRDRTLALRSDAHTYEQPGPYRILVKVVDIFGNDTSQVFKVVVE
ncbi:MAG: site-specific DNA-methyltransferase [Anaerolineae bacterium]|nr:site-specific DNA-methyltransferase [Anaerolineae bacterium]